MTSTYSTDEPTPIIRILRNFIKKGNQILRFAKVHPGNVKLWSGGVRSHLAKIYGKNAPEYDDYFPLTTPDLPEYLAQEDLRKRISHLQRIIEGLEKLPFVAQTPSLGKRIFIGHGRSPLWRELKDFIAERLNLPWDEFNREVVAGYTTSERLQTMMEQAGFAFLIMTAEEEGADTQLRARPNVIHEVGLFQGYLGLNRAIVLLEDGCAEFSNIIGLSQIRFPTGDISARFEEVRRVLEREGVL
jgi:hypothetical protein